MKAEFWKFICLCKKIGNESSSTQKTVIIKEFIEENGGIDLYLLCKLLLAKQDSRVYHLGDKKLVKIFAAMLEADSEKAEKKLLLGGDASEVCAELWSSGGDAPKLSSFSLAEIDKFLESLTELTKQKDHVQAFEKLLSGRAIAEDVRWLVRLIAHDLKINVGAKYVLTAVHPKAFEAWKKSNDLRRIIDKVKAQEMDEEEEAKNNESGDDEASASPKKSKLKKKFSVSISNGVPIKPMLARATKSYADAVKRCKNGMRVEIKYDGERLQIHKNGDTFKVFSRNLKPVQEWKIADVKEYLPQATTAKSVILDCEVLLVSSKTGLALPFGTFNKHKKDNFSEAQPCLFIFDILALEGVALIDRPFDERRKVLESTVNVVANRICLSELHRPNDEDELKVLMTSVMLQKLEGLLIKDSQGVYEPAARHWLKMKKDYLDDGSMADSADLCVMGAYYGSGDKGGLLSTLLLGVRDEDGNFRTVCKCGNGMSDLELDTNQAIWKKLMKECSSAASIPKGLKIDNKHVPDMVMTDMKNAPVYEIAGAEFSETNHHTAGISIRFPRFVKLRDDKDVSSATSWKELQDLAKESKTVGAQPASKKLKKSDGEKTKNATPKKATKAAASPKKKKQKKDEEEDEEEEEIVLHDNDDEEELVHKDANAFKSREKCKWDPDCKRKNEDHFKQFAHPSQKRTVCKFGKHCKRQNPAHFKEEMHPDEL